MTDEERREKKRERERLRKEARRVDPTMREADREYFRERMKSAEAKKAHREAQRRHREKPGVKERERNRRKYLRRIADPEKKRADRELTEQRRRERIALPDGHSGECDVCGVIPAPMKDGKRGICQDHRHDNGVIRGFLCRRCNIEMAVIDLRYTDPDRFAAMLAYSVRGEPVIPTSAERPKRRKAAPAHPVLFEE